MQINTHPEKPSIKKYYACKWFILEKLPHPLLVISSLLFKTKSSEIKLVTQVNANDIVMSAVEISPLPPANQYDTSC